MSPSALSAGDSFRLQSGCTLLSDSGMPTPAWLQIINRDLYVERAEQNRTVTTTSQGSRGLIFDRNGTLLAGNRLSWSLEVTSSQTAEPVEQLFDRLAEIIPITSADRRRYRRLRENF